MMMMIPARFSHIELCVIDLTLGGNTFRLFNCYRPPASSNRDQVAIDYISGMCQCIEHLYPTTGSIIICGDFNFPSINWSHLNCLQCVPYTCTGIFSEFCLRFGLGQFVTSPTHLNNILDIVLSDDANCIYNTRTSTPFSTSDHNMVNFNIVNNHINVPSNNLSYYNYDRAGRLG